jgi:hypothetical protein
MSYQLATILFLLAALMINLFALVLIVIRVRKYTSGCDNKVDERDMLFVSLTVMIHVYALGFVLGHLVKALLAFHGHPV